MPSARVTVHSVVSVFPDVAVTCTLPVGTSPGPPGLFPLTVTVNFSNSSLSRLTDAADNESEVADALAGLTAQVKLVEPLTPVLSFAVTETEFGPAVVGVPVTRPEELIDRPGAARSAAKLRAEPPESVALICRLTEGRRSSSGCRGW